jgi:nitroimidazol reductase NimA-like FMN-containing flavoprotein (pyridoxamine 5'-phosphate oxidase superfamily)
MRRSQCEVKDKAKMEEILGRCRVGRLATIGADGYPYVTPLNYVYWNEAIYFHCARKGEKLDNIAADPRVCFEVDIPLAYKGTDCDPESPACNVHQFYHSVIIRGRAEIVEDAKEKVAALNALMAVHEGIPGFDRIKVADPAVAACHVIAIRIERMSGKSDLAQKKSDEDKARIRAYLEKRGLAGDLEAAALIR